MIAYYLKIAVRNFSRDKIFSSLNLLGLSLGFAASIFLLLYIGYEKSYDAFHANHRDLYRVQYHGYASGELVKTSARTVPRIGPFMKEIMPEVRNYARAYPYQGMMEANKKQFLEERIYFADASFLSIFDFGPLHGDVATPLLQPNEVALTVSTAERYFGHVDVVGETFVLSSRFNEFRFPLKVVAVVSDVPYHSHFKFDFLVSFATFNSINQGDDGYIASEDSWDWDSFYTYVLLAGGTNPVAFDERFDEILQQSRAEAFERYDQRQAYPLQPITDIHLYSRLDDEAIPEEQGDGRAILLLSIIALLIIGVACVNYINLSTAKAIARAKEVGIRKTMGARKGQLVNQFLVEAFLFNFFAVAIGLVLAFGSMRLYHDIVELNHAIKIWNAFEFWSIVLGAFIAAFLFSGIYPSQVLASMEPSTGLREVSPRRGHRSILRKLLVVFQFAISIALIAGAIIVFQQMKHLKNTDLGFDPSDLLVVKAPFSVDHDRFPSRLEAFRNDLLQESLIVSMTSSSSIPGEEIIWRNAIKRFGESDKQLKSTSFVEIDYSYFDTFDVKLMAGRGFQKTSSTDTGAVVLNRAAIRRLGFPTDQLAIGQKVMLYDETKTIIGVVDDYKQMSARVLVPPIVFLLSDNNWPFMIVKAQISNDHLIPSVQASFDRVFPGNAFEYFHFNDFFKRLYKEDERFQGIFGVFTILSIVIACLGLLGLASYSAFRRRKEIGIRKILGASVSSILKLLSTEYLAVVVIANVIAIPVILISMEHWLENFATRVTIGISVFLWAGALAVAVALLTIGFQTLKAANANPVNALRCE